MHAFSLPRCERTISEHKLYAITVCRLMSAGAQHCAYFACRCVKDHLSYTNTHHLHYWTSPSSVLFVCLSQPKRSLLLNCCWHLGSCRLCACLFTFTPHNKGFNWLDDSLEEDSLENGKRDIHHANSPNSVPGRLFQGSSCTQALQRLRLLRCWLCSPLPVCVFCRGYARRALTRYTVGLAGCLAAFCMRGLRRI